MALCNVYVPCIICAKADDFKEILLNRSSLIKSVQIFSPIVATDSQNERVGNQQEYNPGRNGLITDVAYS